MNKLDKQNIPILFPVLVGLLIGVFAGVLITVILFVMTATEKPMSTYEAFSLFLNLLVIIAAILTIGCTWFSMHMQKRQWLNESFIRREAEKLIELRDKLDSSADSVRFFFSSLLKPYKEYGFVPDEKPTIAFSDVSKHFDALVDLNNFYNQNQYIFRKHGLEKQLECIPTILEAARYLPNRDLNYLLIEETDNSQKYRLESEALNIIISSFNLQAYMLHDVDDGVFPTIDDLNSYNLRDKEEELSRLSLLTSQELLSLNFKLDELTLFLDSAPSKSLGIRKLRYFQKKSIKC
jgi:hypothetical protein